MSPDKRIIVNAAVRDIFANLVKLCAALCVLAYFIGGPTTRAWMTGFFIGTVAGLTGEPSVGRASSLTSDTPVLRLLGHSCRKEYGYEICEGEVRNVSSERLENVMAEVRFQDQAGTFVKSESTMIEYQPLMPGQTSPFKVATTSNPLIRHFTIGFKEMFGGAIKLTR